MKMSCIINNYNYALFVKDAIESALNQSRPFDEIIVVDDCSTDDSRRIIESLAERNNNLKCIFKQKNGGQLSCFNEGYRHITGEVAFFLDSDDRYKPNYLEQVATLYEHNKHVDYVFTDFETIGEHVNNKDVKLENDYYIPCSVIITFFSHVYLGGRTSVISMKKNILDKILPLDLEDDWRIRADDCLVWGSSLVGASKYYLAKKMVEYRVHEQNSWYGRKDDTNRRIRRLIAVNRFFSFFKNKIFLDEKILEKAYLEFRLLPNPELIPNILKKYREAILASNISFRHKLRNLVKIQMEYYWKLFRHLYNDKKCHIT